MGRTKTQKHCVLSSLSLLCWEYKLKRKSSKIGLPKINHGCYKRKSYQIMYDRPWQHVFDFYSDIVKGQESLSALFGTETYSVPSNTEIPKADHEMELEGVASKDKSGRWGRVTFKIVLSYHGGSFDGWQKQPGLNTVQGIVEISTGRFVDEKKAQLLKENCKSLEGCVVVAGRTDKGVSALQQVCSFSSWRNDIKPYDIEDAINLAAPGKIRVVSVSEVSRSFHPTFSAKWRRYLYIFPLTDGENAEESSENEEDVEKFVYDETYGELSNGPDEDDFESKKIPKRFSVSRVNQLLRQLEGKLLSYRMFARDTKASRSIGPSTVFHLPCPSHCSQIAMFGS